MNISVRKAKKSDSYGFIELVLALAKFESLSPPTSEGRRRLVRDIFDKRKLSLYLAFVEGKAVGYALYFFTYSSFLARPTLYLEDIFVLEEYRGKRIGLKLFRSCAREAKQNGCGRMEWNVLTWNSNAIRFYEKLGARRLKEWHYYRLDEKGIRENLKE